MSDILSFRTLTCMSVVRGEEKEGLLVSGWLVSKKMKYACDLVGKMKRKGKET